MQLGPHRTGTVALAVLGCSVAIAACGSSGSSSATASSSAHNQGIQFADCMRSHGVPSFPDPSSGGGIHITAGSGINPFSPAFKAAQSACNKLLPGGGPGGHGAPSEQAKEQMLAISECMRAHGITSFPDPTTMPPSGPGYSQVLGRGGVFLAVPDTINAASPAYTRAAATCKFG